MDRHAVSRAAFRDRLRASLAGLRFSTATPSDHFTRTEAERMVAAAVAVERERHEAEMQSLAEGVDAGFRAIGRALDKAAGVLELHGGYLVDLTTLAIAEEVRAGRLDPATLTRSGKRRARHHQARRRR